MRILVTGATGFLGSHIVEKLLNEGHEVIAGKRASSNTRWLPVERVQLVDFDYDNTAETYKIIASVDAIVHNAGISKAKNISEYFEVNTVLTEKLVKSTIDANPTIKRFVYISSQAASCPGCADDRVCEETPSRPLTAYGKSKHEAEKILKKYADKIPITILRPPPVYGPRDTDVFFLFKMIDNNIMPFVGDPDRQFSAIYVKDLANAVFLVLTIPHESGSIYFATDGKVHSWRSFEEAIAEELGKKPIKIRIPGWAFYPFATSMELVYVLQNRAPLVSREKVKQLLQNWVCRDDLIRKELGYSSEYDLKRGLGETVRWYRENGWLRKK